MDIKPIKIRLKITGKCNKSCFFCHKEGGDNIDDFLLDDDFINCMNEFEKIGIKNVILTGGEPTLCPDFEKICQYLSKKFHVTVVTNGSIVKDWSKIQVNKITISIHSLNPEKMIKLENIKRTKGWAKKEIEKIKINITNIINSKKEARINLVVTDRESLKEAENLSHTGIEVRLLNNLNDIKNSQKIINNFIKEKKATKKYEYRRMSNHTAYYDGELKFSTKISYPFYFDAICKDCSFKKKCYEGFYGLRLEKRGGYYVRLCLYKNLIYPYKDFLKSRMKNDFLKLC